MPGVLVLQDGGKMLFNSFDMLELSFCNVSTVSQFLRIPFAMMT